MRLLLLTALLASTPALAGDVFTESTLSRAQSSAEPDDKLVLVYLYVADNDECVFMEREAWQHPDVRSWVNDHAVATRVEAFSFHGAALRSRYHVDGTPAVLAFDGERLLGQHVGSLSADQLLAWVKGARSPGGTSVAASPEGAAAAPSQGKTSDTDVEDAVRRAMALDDPESAASTLLDAWRQTAGTTQQEARRPMLTEALKPLVRKSFAANRKVTGGRDTAWKRWERDQRIADLIDWIALNVVLEEDAATARWLEQATQDGCHAKVDALFAHPQDPVLDLLIRQRKWRTIGACLADPIATLTTRHEHYRKTKITITGSQSQRDLDQHRERQAALAAGLLAAGHNRSGKRAARHQLELDSGSGPTIVQVALTAEQPRRWHRKMLNVGDRDQVDLAIDLAKALSAR